MCRLLERVCRGMNVARFCRICGTLFQGRKLQYKRDVQSCLSEILEVGEKEPSSDGSVNEEPGEIVSPDVTVENDMKDWGLKGFKTAEEGDSSGLQCERRALQER